jgi:hypothetical protein
MNMDYYISMFIDNELGLDEKIEFVKIIHEDTGVYQEAVELLEQEKWLGSEISSNSPLAEYKEKKKWFAFMNVKPFMAFASAGAMAVIIALLMFPIHKDSVSSMPHRFIIYRPDVSKVEISGSFIDWKVLPLTRIGSSGYWQIELDVPKGEHRYTYIVGGEERVADPTILTREQDDFGGENSILTVGA